MYHKIPKNCFFVKIIFQEVYIYIKLVYSWSFQFFEYLKIINVSVIFHMYFFYWFVVSDY